MSLNVVSRDLTSIDVEGIMRMIPHRYPFLLVDRVVSVEPGARIAAYKNVTVNEAFFNGHFPGHPVMPGVLICEAMAPAAARSMRRCWIRISGISFGGMRNSPGQTGNRSM